MGSDQENNIHHQDPLHGGQMIWINFDDNRIVVAHAIHSTYDWKKIVADTVKNGLER